MVASITIPGAGSADRLLRFSWNFSNNLAAQQTVDGFRVVPMDCVIEQVWISLVQRGAGILGEVTRVDLNVASKSVPFTTEESGLVFATLYTTQANRPTLTADTPTQNDNIIVEAALPDVVLLAEGDVLSLDIDETVFTAEDLTVEVFARVL